MELWYSGSDRYPESSTWSRNGCIEIFEVVNMELSELTEKECSDVITDINKIMSEKYNISNKSINNFWKVLTFGTEYLNQVDKFQKVNIDVMYR